LAGNTKYRKKLRKIKVKIKKQFRDYLNNLLNYKNRLYQFTNRQFDYNDARWLHMNSQFLKTIKLMNQDNVLSENSIIPSIFKLYGGETIIRPFWNDKIQVLSDKLYLPDYNNLCQFEETPKQFQNTWFKSEFYMPTGNLNRLYKLKTKKKCDDFKALERVKKIKLYLTTKQKKYMKIIIGTYRYFYNRTIQVIKSFNKDTREAFYYIDRSKEETKITIKLLPNKYTTDFFYMRSLLKENEPNWILKNIPSHLISEAIHEAVKKYNECIDKYKKTKKPFKMSFKSKKDKLQTINLEKSMITYQGLFHNFKIDDEFLFRNIKKCENITKNHKGSTVTFNKDIDEFYLNATYEIIPKKQHNNKNICALDQNLFNFLALYSPNHVGIIGKKASNVLYKKCLEVDIIQSRINSTSYEEKNKIIIVNAEKRRSLKKAFYKKIEEIKNYKRELHDKSINYLINNYTTIIISPFEVQNMASKLLSQTARSMYNLSFYEFRMNLKEKCKEKNIKLIVKQEYYTSKTCTGCGHIKLNLKMSDREYNCDFCQLKIDRDFAGARNQILRNLSFA